MRPIKTSLLSVAEPWVLDCPVAVQPVTLVYARLADGTPIGRGNCDLYAWHADAEFVPHLWGVLQLGGVEIRVVAGDPVLSWSVQEPQGARPRAARASSARNSRWRRLRPVREPIAELLDGRAAGLS